MKYYFLPSLLATVILTSCSSNKNFVSKKPKNEKSTVSFKDPKTSVVFFGKNDDTEKSKEHQKQKIDIYNYLYPIANTLPVYDINDGKLVEYNNQKKKTFFYKNDVKKQYGMVVSNGKDMPVVVTDPKKYLNKITTYLSVDEKNLEKEKKRLEEEAKKIYRDIDGFVKKDFTINKAYASLVIKNSKTDYYPQVVKSKSKKQPSCSKKIYQSYTDYTLKNKLDNNIVNTYDINKNILKTEYIDENSKPLYAKKYFRNKLGLLDSIKSNVYNQNIKIQFIYKKDKFITVTYDEKKPVNYEIYFLNDLKQNIGKQAYSKTPKENWDSFYRYDKFGRIEEEKDAKTKTVYQYKKDTDKDYSELIKYDIFTNKQLQKNLKTVEKNKVEIIALGEDNSLKFKSVTTMGKNGNDIQVNYDELNTLSSIVFCDCYSNPKTKKSKTITPKTKLNTNNRVVATR